MPEQDTWPQDINLQKFDRWRFELVTFDRQSILPSRHYTDTIKMFEIFLPKHVNVTLKYNKFDL